MVAIRFTGNYEDLSTDRGYQFKFYCEKCQNGYMSSFKTSTIGVLGSAARAAGSLFGGIFGNVADSSYEVQRAVGGGAHDSALKEAVDEMTQRAPARLALVHHRLIDEGAGDLFVRHVALRFEDSQNRLDRAVRDGARLVHRRDHVADGCPAQPPDDRHDGGFGVGERCRWFPCHVASNS